ncbi:MAG: SCO family protein [Acidocella sp.]|nr:SCO family protein [Acidocella sp.]
MAGLTRRQGLVWVATLWPAGLAWADDGPAYADIAGELPNLQFEMILASSGAPVTAADFAGHPVILYFGFTRCTDTCPLTMENAAKLVRKMGADGQQLRVLFVTIDPAYDTPAVLKKYLENFGVAPVFDGLHGTIAQLAALAKRYGVEYTAVTSADAPDPVSGITHSDAVYGFGPSGKARYILGTLAQGKANIDLVAGLMKPLLKT